ncbi:MAG: class IIb bacteriocin, lactobin A/cerein 7B family [Cyclobacteriaceae bacterium]
MRIDEYNLQELDNKQLSETEGGILALAAGIAVGVILGAGTTVGTYYAVKALLK